MATPANSGWPARFVIGVQLGVWCVVGALLLHMGMSSFTPEATPPLNTTMVSPTPSNSGWPARFVIGVQLGVWCVVGALLLHMGMSSFTPEATPPLNTTMVSPTPSLNDTADYYSDISANSTQTLPKGNLTIHPTKKTIYKPSSVLMITVGATMLILGPIVLIIREIDTRRQYHSFVKLPVRYLSSNQGKYPVATTCWSSARRSARYPSGCSDRLVARCYTSIIVGHGTGCLVVRDEEIDVRIPVGYKSLSSVTVRCAAPPCGTFHAPSSGGSPIVTHLKCVLQFIRKVDPPPSYDDVTEPAPRYSTLFEVGEGGECIAINCPSADVYGGEGRKPVPCFEYTLGRPLAQSVTRLGTELRAPDSIMLSL
uniref:(California timema) hypothetical protein n=1 Tax=Timema californicum TaxID=61474 RepID=A0A7R9JEC5_TIMCA|nr:unnamed protein product [Timema californicum]